jgi:hypothetical protein
MPVNWQKLVCWVRVSVVPLSDRRLDRRPPWISRSQYLLTISLMELWCDQPSRDLLFVSPECLRAS